MVVGKEFGGRLTQPTPGAAGTIAVPALPERLDNESWSREGDLFPPTLSPAGTSLAGRSRCRRRDLGRNIRWALSGPALGKGTATGRAKVLQRGYSRGQWRRPKSYDGSTIVSRSLQQQQKPRGRRIFAGTLGASSGRAHIKSRGMVTRTTRRGWLWRRSSERGNVCSIREKSHNRRLAMCSRDVQKGDGEGISRMACHHVNSAARG